jgi:hypothetical protein
LQRTCFHSWNCKLTCDWRPFAAVLGLQECWTYSIPLKVVHSQASIFRHHSAMINCNVHWQRRMLVAHCPPSQKMITLLWPMDLDTHKYLCAVSRRGKPRNWSLALMTVGQSNIVCSVCKERGHQEVEKTWPWWIGCTKLHEVYWQQLGLSTTQFQQ